ncbi:MAG TPA: beta-ketoacyl synthase N-terminal-like domain-containing protein [Bacteroidales bacterium]|nr:beta-ketoacyl synthase N-terminal-like domain-containing protein [Bacteroidales bacterium]
MSVYITGIGKISVQPSGQSGSAPQYFETRYARCSDPAFSDYINPMEARRMSTIIKRAIVSTQMALGEAGIEMPGAVITGTGLGCIEDTEKFLTSMINDNEKFLKPTYFIHSTHNTISSQVAIRLKCNGYNNTFVHRGISFELALHDAMLLFMQKKVHSALVGGHDEMTPAYFNLLDRIGYWKKEIVSSSSLHTSNSAGSVAGEGSISLVLSDEKSPSAYARITDVSTFYNGNGTTDPSERIEAFLSLNGLKPSDIDLVMTGINGDVNDNNVYYQVLEKTFKNNPAGWYKHLSLEYFTSPAFGLQASAQCLKSGNIPEHLRLKGNFNGKPEHILLYNHFKNRNHSLILLSSC